MTRPLNTAATLSLARECAELAKAGVDHLAEGSPLARELREIDTLTRVRIEWYVMGHKHGAEDYKEDLNSAEREAFDEIAKRLDPNARAEADQVAEAEVDPAGYREARREYINPWKAPVAKDPPKVAPTCYHRAAREERISRALAIGGLIALGWGIVAVLALATSHALHMGGR